MGKEKYAFAFAMGAALVLAFSVDALASESKGDRMIPARSVWKLCVNLQLLQYAKVAGSADEAIDASKGGCGSTRKRLTAQLRERGATPQVVRTIFEGWDQDNRPDWVKQYLDLRLKDEAE